MSDNTRVIIVQPCEKWPDGYIPVNSCANCKCYYLDIMENFCCGINEIDIGRNPYAIHKDCRLPLLPQVKKHPPGEKPKDEINVLVKLIDSNEIVIGHYNYGWSESQTGNYIKDELIEYWQEIPK